MFSRFQSRRQKRRGSSEDPAAPFRVIRRDADASSQELIDYALIDATVNEWMADLGKEQAEKRKSATEKQDKALSPTEPLDAARVAFPTRPGSSKVVSASRPASRLISPIPHDTPPSRPKRTSGKLDRVMREAITQRLLTEQDLRQMMKEQGQVAAPDWRTVCSWMPEHAHSFARIAARVYGFRSVLICQMGTLVLADLLTMRIPEHFWRRMVEAGVIPVVEHGMRPDPSERVVCVSNDPSSRTVRALLDEVKAISPELAYADAHHIRTTMDLLSQHISSIGAQVTTVRPVMKRIDPGKATTTDGSGNMASDKAA